MLVLSRRSNETVVVGGADGIDRLVTVTVLDIGEGRVKLGFDASASIPVHRGEVWERVQAARPPIPEAKLESAIGSARAVPEEFGRFEDEKC